MKTLGQRIRELREDRDQSLRELAKKIGVSAAFLSDVELARRFPSDEHMKALAVELDTTLGELQKNDTRPPFKEFRRVTASDPAYGLAFRKLIDEKVSPEELLKFVESRSDTEEEAGGDNHEDD